MAAVAAPASVAEAVAVDFEEGIAGPAAVAVVTAAVPAPIALAAEEPAVGGATAPAPVVQIQVHPWFATYAGQAEAAAA